MYPRLDLSNNIIMLYLFSSVDCALMALKTRDLLALCMNYMHRRQSVARMPLYMPDLRHLVKAILVRSRNSYLLYGICIPSPVECDTLGVFAFALFGARNPGDCPSHFPLPWSLLLHLREFDQKIKGILISNQFQHDCSIQACSMGYVESLDLTSTNSSALCTGVNPVSQLKFKIRKPARQRFLAQLPWYTGPWSLQENPQSSLRLIGFLLYFRKYDTDSDAF